MTDVNLPIQGSKKGGSRTPVEAPNNLKSEAIANILDLVSEGEIVGLVDGLKSIYLDETPIQNPDGSANFVGVQVEERFGTATQDPIAGWPSVENELGIGLELQFGTPYTRAFNNLNLDALRVRLSVGALSQTNTKNGDTNGYTVNYAIDLSTDGGPFTQVLTSAFSGKTMSEFEREHRIDLPKATSTGWVLRVRRTTPQSETQTIQDKTYVKGIVEVIDGRLRYPHSAIIGVRVAAENFPSVPTRIYDLKGRIIRVPTNYNPETRTYAGIWDGTYKLAWSNNPAWVYLDLVTNERYGLGHRLNDSHINKWMLYRIAQYCDQMVPDGKSGFEPRFTCNLYLQRQAEAYKVLQDLATVFRGIAYWGFGQINPVSDMPEDVSYTYTPANVVNGKFVYQGSSAKTRHTVALVSWNDPGKFGRSTIEYVDYPEGIARYGIQETDMTAIACSSQGQAQRMGRYLLATAQEETQTVSFSVGLEGTLVAPGKIVRIADPLRQGRRMAGRVRSATSSSVAVDKVPPGVTVGDTITITNRDMTQQSRTISGVDATNNIIAVSVGFTQAPAAESVWVVEQSILQAPKYRILSIEETDDGTYQVSAIQHIEGKFQYVDNQIAIQIPPTTGVPLTSQSPPTNVTLTSREMAGEVIAQTVVTIDWQAPPNAVSYVVEWRRDELNWEQMPETNATTVEIPNAWAGSYQARVRARNPTGVLSSFAVSPVLVVGDQEKAPFFIEDVQTNITSLSSELTSIDQRASNAANQAASALLAAQSANTQIGNLVSDNILTPNEKPMLIQQWAILEGEKPGLVAQATDLAITTELEEYEAAYTILDEYLDSLTTPVPWNNLSDNTVIDH